MKIPFNKSMLSIALLSLMTNDVFASANNQNMQLLEERVTILEHQQQVNNKTGSYSPVVATPQLNLREKFNSTPPYDQDLAMLKLRKRFNHGAKQRNLPALPYPKIEFGGSLNAFMQERRPPIGSSHSNLNLNGATLNAAAEVTDWLLGYINLGYDPNPAPKFIRNSPTLFDTSPISNSNIYLSTGFLVFGDLTRFPLYVTVGQTYLPFGEYSTSMLAAPLPARLGRTKQRAILVGFQQPKTNDGFNASLFFFKGNTKFANHTAINNGGANAGYALNTRYFKLNAGASYLANIADSGGMQESGPSTIVNVDGTLIDDEFITDDEDQEFPTVTVPVFTGFSGNEKLVHRVPAADLRAKLVLHRLPVFILGEYNRATTTFAPSNLSYNTLGAQPSAWHIEAGLRFKLLNLPNSIAASYDISRESLALNIPKTSTALAYTIVINRYINAGLEYRYDKNYPSGSTATGQTLTVPGVNVLGKTSQSGLLMLNVRF